MLFTQHRKIALTGLYNSGKTVFLTSLLSHLSNTSSDFSPEVDDKEWRFEPLPLPGGVEAEFPFNANRERLIRDGLFPLKTTATTRFRCNIYPTRDSWAPYRVEFIDCPGERFADAYMYGQSYEKWSDAVIASWKQSGHHSIADYLATCEASTLDFESVTRAFKRMLAEKLLACEPLITPSTFKLAEDGTMPGGSSVEEILNHRTAVSVNGESEFAPLPGKSRTRHPELAKRMSEHYDVYQKTIVQPLFSELAGCDSLIVLVDIPFLLAAGPGAVNDNHWLLDTIINAIRPWPVSSVVTRKKTQFKSAVGWLLGFQWSDISKIAFVANKSDLVSTQDANQLLSLLKEMGSPLKKLPVHVEWEYFVASAVISTESLDRQSKNGTAWLSGRLMLDYSVKPPKPLPKTEGKQAYEVSRLPSTWPREWNRDDYCFPPVYPDIPAAHFACPDQKDLDKVFRFVLK